MSHGERAIVPFNFFLIAATVLLWAVSLPLWSTLAIALPIAVALGRIAGDKYGGMQLCVLITPGWMVGTIFLAKAVERAEETDATVSVGPLVVGFLGSVLGFIVLLVVALALMVGVILAWEWGVARVRRRWASEPPERTNGPPRP